MELVEVLSRLDAAPLADSRGTLSESSRDEPAQRIRPWTEAVDVRAFAARRNLDLRVTTATMAVTHLGCVWMLRSAGAPYLGSLIRSSHELADAPVLLLISATCVGVCLVVGPALALWGLYGLLKNRGWAETVLRTYAVTAAATLLLAPMAACLLVLLRRGDPQLSPKA